MPVVTGWRSNLKQTNRQINIKTASIYNMNCNQASKFIYTGLQSDDLDDHLKNCTTCSELVGKIRETMDILDEKVDIPSGLTEKTILNINGLKVVKAPVTIDFSKYLQIAAVISVGIFLGILLGSRANPQIFLSKKDKKERDLIEYRDQHHMNDQSTINSFI